MGQEFALMVEHFQAVLMPRFMFCVFLFRNVGSFATCRVVVPLLRDEQLAVDEGVSFSRNVSTKGSDLTVIDFAETPQVLSCDSGGLFAVLFKSTRIKREDAVSFSVQFRGLCGDAVEDDLVIPDGFADETLEGPSILAESIGDGLDVFAFDVGQESFDERGRVFAGFGSRQVLEKGLQKGVESSECSGEVFFVNFRILFNLTFSGFESLFHEPSVKWKSMFYTKSGCLGKINSAI
jgi:hypothetical protein